MISFPTYVILDSVGTIRRFCDLVWDASVINKAQIIESISTPILQVI